MKIATSIYVSMELIAWAKAAGINISAVVEHALKAQKEISENEEEKPLQHYENALREAQEKLKEADDNFHKAVAELAAMQASEKEREKKELEDDKLLAQSIRDSGIIWRQKSEYRNDEAETQD